MFRSVAVYLDQTLQKCMRNDGGWPLQQQLASKETSAADSLQDQTLVKMAENVNMYQKKNEQQGYDKDFNADFGSFQERLKQMKNPSVYAGEEELISIVDVVEHPIHVHQSYHKNCYGDDYEQAAAPIHLKYTPEKAATGTAPKVPAHYDFLLDTLYPKAGDFVALKFGMKKWYMAQVSDIDHSIPEIEVKFMARSGNTYIFTDEQQSWVDIDKILLVCTTPDIDQRQRYIFAVKDIETIKQKMK